MIRISQKVIPVIIWKIAPKNKLGDFEEITRK
jgi:hypothetical protein